jgi:hypothetical protein
VSLEDLLVRLITAAFVLGTLVGLAWVVRLMLQV